MIRLTTLLCLVLAMSGLAHSATLINLEEAAEVSDLRINTDGVASGFVYARICDACELLKLRLGNDSRILRKRQPLHLDDAQALRGKGATVMFDPQTLKITRIIYWN